MARGKAIGRQKYGAAKSARMLLGEKWHASPQQYCDAIATAAWPDSDD